jgi:hypothetical protein
MATPFLAYENAAILWEAPGARLGGRDGFRVTSGQAYLIGAFLKREGHPGEVGDRGPGSAFFPGIGGAVSTLSGYVTRYSAVSAEDLAAASPWWGLDWADLSATINPSGYAPDGFRRDSTGRVYVPGIAEGAVTVASIGSAFGTSGIGALLRQRTGDPVRLHLGEVG